MSLWWLGPPPESLQLEEPGPPADEHRIPRLIRSVVTSHFVNVACGGAHALALTNDGRVFAWGWNAFGQCGLGDDCHAVATPRVVSIFSGRIVAHIGCGGAHSVAFVQDEEDSPCSVYAWGANAAGQLGFVAKPQLTRHASPTRIELLHGTAGLLADGPELGVCAAATGIRMAQPLGCGAAHSALVSASGSLWTWGSNVHGQCGRQEIGVASAPEAVHKFQHQIVTGVACGSAHTLALTSTGSLYAFGMNATGQLGIGTHHRKPSSIPQCVRLDGVTVVSIACGDEFSACVTSSGDVLTWGFGGCGQLGQGNKGSACVPRQVPCDACDHVSCASGCVLALTSREGVATWGFLGLWSQMQQHGQNETTICSNIVPEPDWRPRCVELSGTTYSGVVVSGQQVSPVSAIRVAAGRCFGVIIGKPVDASACEHESMCPLVPTWHELHVNVVLSCPHMFEPLRARSARRRCSSSVSICFS